MAAELGPGHLEEWRAYADLEPFDEERADYRAASIVQAIYNSRRTRGQSIVKLVDCLLRFLPKEDPDSPDGAATMSGLDQLVDLARTLRARRRAKVKASRKIAARRLARATAPRPTAVAKTPVAVRPRKVGR